VGVGRARIPRNSRTSRTGPSGRAACGSRRHHQGGSGGIEDVRMDSCGKRGRSRVVGADSGLVACSPPAAAESKFLSLTSRAGRSIEPTNPLVTKAGPVACPGGVTSFTTSKRTAFWHRLRPCGLHPMRHDALGIAGMTVHYIRSGKPFHCEGCGAPLRKKHPRSMPPKLCDKCRELVRLRRSRQRRTWCKEPLQPQHVGEWHV